MHNPGLLQSHGNELSKGMKNQTYKVSDYLDKKDFDNMITHMGNPELAGTAKDANAPDVKSWNVIDNLYRHKIKVLDKRLADLEVVIKPKAYDMAKGRTVELINLLDEKAEIDRRDVARLLRETENVGEVTMIKQLREIMNKYNIKHPLRGEEFENCVPMKQEFARKIIQKAIDPKTFLEYKKDRRATLDQSYMKSDEFFHSEQEAF